jgi:DNA-binding NarL/FixJ family response regulator
MNGLDALTAIRAEFPDTRIIVLTTYTGDVQIDRPCSDARNTAVAAISSASTAPASAPSCR